MLQKTSRIFTWREDVLGEPGGGHWHDDIAPNAAPLSLGRTSVGEADKAKLGWAVSNTNVIIIEIIFFLNDSKSKQTKQKNKCWKTEIKLFLNSHK